MREQFGQAAGAACGNDSLPNMLRAGKCAGKMAAAARRKGSVPSTVTP